jgi:NOL1/NOP2/fmu family ribosome biogenesis protein
MQQLEILNTRDIKHIKNLIKEQWDSDIKLDYGFLKSRKDKIYIVNKAISDLDLSKLRIDSVGLYFGQLTEAGLRLSIEGSQIIGPHAKKNIVELDMKQIEDWFKGYDLDIKLEYAGYVILKNNKDYLGCGKSTKAKILNFVPKPRRTKIISFHQ